MKNITKVALTALLGFTLLTTTATADAAKGTKVYKKFMMADCGGVKGIAVSGKYKQSEWKKISEKGQFKAELEKICPNNKAFLNGIKFKKLESHVFDFMFEYAKGSGNVAGC